MEKKQSKVKEKKEYMANKMVMIGRGKKKDIMEGLEHMAKHPSVKHYRSGDSHIRRGEAIRDRATYRD